MKQRKHRGNKTFIITYQDVHVTSAGKHRMSPKQSLAASGTSAPEVLRGFMFGRAPESVFVTSVHPA